MDFFYFIINFLTEFLNIHFGVTLYSFAIAFFFLLYFGLIFFALCVISSENPIYSVLSLIIVFFFFTFILYFMKMEFLMLMFLIVYIGAIAVFFLFIVMLIDFKLRPVFNKFEILFGFLFLIFFFFSFVFLLRSDSNFSLVRTNFVDLMYLSNFENFQVFNLFEERKIFLNSLLHDDLNFFKFLNIISSDYSFKIKEVSFFESGFELNSIINRGKLFDSIINKKFDSMFLDFFFPKVNGFFLNSDNIVVYFKKGFFNSNLDLFSLNKFHENVLNIKYSYTIKGMKIPNVLLYEKLLKKNSDLSIDLLFKYIKLSNLNSSLNDNSKFCSSLNDFSIDRLFQEISNQGIVRCYKDNSRGYCDNSRGYCIYVDLIKLYTFVTGCFQNYFFKNENNDLNFLNENFSDLKKKCEISLTSKDVLKSKNMFFQFFNVSFENSSDFSTTLNGFVEKKLLEIELSFYVGFFNNANIDYNRFFMTYFEIRWEYIKPKWEYLNIKTFLASEFRNPYLPFFKLKDGVSLDLIKSIQDFFNVSQLDVERLSKIYKMNVFFESEIKKRDAGVGFWLRWYENENKKSNSFSKLFSSFEDNKIFGKDLTNISQIGLYLYTNVFLGFFLSGLLLLVAILGCLCLTLEDKSVVFRRQKICDQTLKKYFNGISKSIQK